jgi:hypothetical protein
MFTTSKSALAEVRSTAARADCVTDKLAAASTKKPADFNEIFMGFIVLVQKKPFGGGC